MSDSDMEDQAPVASPGDSMHAAEKQWREDVLEISARSGSWRLRKFPPELQVLDDPPDGRKIDASTHGNKLFATRSALGVSPVLRRYLIAHELGHMQGLHTFKSSGGPLLGLLAVLPLARAMASHEWAAALCAAVAMLAGMATVWLYKRSMLFEWEADRMGADMVGARAMELGIEESAKISPADAAYYKSKLEKLRRATGWSLGVDARR